MAEYASDFIETPDLNPHSGDLDVVLGLGIFPKLTREQRNAVRAAAITGGYLGARDAIDALKPGAGPWIDLFTSHPTDASKVAGIRARWVWFLTARGDIPPVPPLP